MRIEQPSINVCRVISDNEETLDWNVSVFNHTRFKTVDDPFRDVNRYWASLSAQRRQQIFNCYKEIREIISRVGTVGDDQINIRQLGQEIPAKITLLYSLMPFEEMERWTEKYSRVIYPTGLKEVHDVDDPMPDRTYLVSDYRGLVVLTTALRPMVPIWGEYIRLIQKSTGTLFKEHVAIKLISQSHLAISKPYLRLERYIRCCITNDVDTRGAVVNGISKAEIPEWLLAIVSIRRLSVGEIDAHEVTGSIITNIYGFVTSTLNDLNKKFGGVREKYPEDKGTGEDGETGSNLEGYRPKQPASTGDLMIFNVYTENVINMAKELDPTVPDELVMKCLESSNCMRTKNINTPHMAILQWVMSDVISPQALASLHKEPLIRVIAATQALLIHWQFYTLALLLNSQGIIPDGSAMAFSSNIRISPAKLEKLNILYPYTINMQGSSGKTTNPAVNAIFSVTRQISACKWPCLANDELMALINSRANGNILVDNSGRTVLNQPDASLSEQLASLIIRVKSEN